MDTTVIQPTAGQAVLKTSDGCTNLDSATLREQAANFRTNAILREQDATVREQAANFRTEARDHMGILGAVKDASDYNAAMREQNALQREQAAGFRTAAQDHTSTVGAIKDARYDLTRAMESGFSDEARTAAQVRKEMQEGFCNVSGSVIGAVGHANEETFKGFREVTGVINHASEMSLANFCDAKDRIALAAKDSALAAKDQQALSYQIEGRLQLEAVRNTTSLATQAEKNYNSLQHQVQATAFLSERLAAAAALQAEKVAAAHAAQAAAYHCEVKELVRSEEDRTRAILGEQERDRLRERAASAEQKLAAYFAAHVQPVVP